MLFHHSYSFKLFTYVYFVGSSNRLSQAPISCYGFVGSSNRLSQAPISCYGFCSLLVINSCSLQTHVAMITNCDCQGFTNCVSTNCVLASIFLVPIYFNEFTQNLVKSLGI
jgi:hypothetical protein